MPETAGPEAGVTVTVIALLGSKRRRRVRRVPAAPAASRLQPARLQARTASYRPPMPFRSPVGEWHVLHVPAALK